MEFVEEETEQQRMIVGNLRRFLKSELVPLLFEMDEKSYFPQDIHQKMGEMGFLCPFMPQRYGGEGVDLMTYAVIAEEIGRVDAGFATSFFVSGVLFGRNVLLHGTEEQKILYLPPLIRGEKMGCWALTEPNVGSDAFNISTRAIKERREFIINGSKTFITNAPIADNFIVLARTGERNGLSGGTAFILDRGMQGLSTGSAFHKMGNRSSPTGEIFMEGVRVSEESVLGEVNEAFPAILQSLDVERSLGSAVMVGLAQACLDASIGYAKDRIQFGKPIASFQLIREKLADMAMSLDMARTYAHHVINLIEQGKPMTKESAILKLFSSEMATRCALEAIQIHGGYGYMKEYTVERYLRDAKLFEIGAGTSEIQRMLIAREVLAGR